MTDQPAANQPTNPTSDASINDYQPPTATPVSGQRPGEMPFDNRPPQPVQTQTQPQPAQTPTQPQPSQTSTQPQPSQSPTGESLEEQNIFFLLGVMDAKDEEKEAFLDELQQVIWEDFIENDVDLLITDSEKSEFQQIMAKGDAPEVQEEMIVYLEKLIPDLEEIMLEKALDLKEDMVRERIAGMREYYVSNPELLAQIDQAENLLNQNKWHSASEMMNQIGQNKP